MDQAHREEWPTSSALSGGRFELECYAPDGTLRWRDTAENATCLAALDDVLNVYLRNGTPKTAWYCLLVDNAGFVQFATADTYTSHTGWFESTAYSEGVRQTWSPGASSGQQVSNGTQMTFTSNATTTIRGLGIVSSNVKGDSTAGSLLLCTAPLSGGNQLVNSGDVIKATYTFFLTPA